MHSLVLALTLVLRTYDMAGASSHEVARAQQATAEILGRARIEVSWIICQPYRTTALPDPACDETTKPSEVIVRLLAASGRKTNTALGEAYVDTGAAFGSLATIYLDRVRSLAAEGDMDPGTLMGRAIAHEVGHLLSGSSSHSSTGLMRPVWSATALRHDTPQAWTFSQREAQHLRRQLNARFNARADGEIALVEPMPRPPLPCTASQLLPCVGTTSR